MIVVNFKTYEKATGENAEKLAEACREASDETGERVIVTPSDYDILRLKDTETEVFAQHIDPVEPGSHTGHVLPGGVKNAGADGTLLNHSERRLDKETVRDAVEHAKKNGLTTIVCAQDPEECETLSSYRPDFVAFEPPELIGGDVSVSEAKPDLIEEAVEKSSVPVLTGAGIKTKADVEKSVELGCEGILVASGVVKAENPGEKIVELCEGL